MSKYLVVSHGYSQITRFENAYASIRNGSLIISSCETEKGIAIYADKNWSNACGAETMGEAKNVTDMMTDENKNGQISRVEVASGKSDVLADQQTKIMKLTDDLRAAEALLDKFGQSDTSRITQYDNLLARDLKATR